MSSVSLGHEFVTDVLQLEFLPAPSTESGGGWLGHSLGYAVLEGAAEVLEVPSNDLNASVLASAESTVPPIIIYDNVPGGAGIVSRLEEETLLKASVEMAIARLARCDCGLNTSCYGCLRSYRNQFAHPHLHRGAALRYLQSIADKWR